MLFGPRAAAWTLALLFALAVSGGVFTIPVQRSESLEIIEAVANLPSAGAAFVGGLQASTSWLRPMRYVHARALLGVARVTGATYNVVFRGYHALLAGVLMLLFVAAAGPRTWTDVSALAFALSVLTGMDTFAGMLREAYPVNHFLVIAIVCTAVLALATTRGGRLVDATAVLCLGLALLTLESGVLVWVVALCAYAGGLRGVSRTGLATMSLVLITYLVVRMGYLHIGANPLGERETGYGLRMLSPDDQIRMFAANPWPLYAYTGASSALNILLSQPVVGEWTAVSAYLAGELRPVFLLEVLTSLAASALIVWYACSRLGPHGRRGYRDPLVVVMAGTLVLSALLSYSYAKNEIMSASGVMYALATYAAAAKLLAAISRSGRPWATVPALVLIAVVSTGWSVRALGLEYKLQRAAYKARNEWVSLGANGEPDIPDTPLASRLHDEALLRGASNPGMLSRYASLYWGDD